MDWVKRLLQASLAHSFESLISVAIVLNGLVILRYGVIPDHPFADAAPPPILATVIGLGVMMVITPFGIFIALATPSLRLAFASNTVVAATVAYYTFLVLLYGEDSAGISHTGRALITAAFFFRAFYLWLVLRKKAELADDLRAADHGR